MAKVWFNNGVTSVIQRLFIPDTTSVLGAGKTGLTFSSAGLIISTIADTEATATTYTQAGSTVETITTLGTFAAPTATKCRFKELDATNLPGIYEIQIADARWAVSGARSLIISLPPVSGLGTGPVRAEIQLFADVNLKWILGTLLTETAGQIAAGFKKLLDVAAPVFTLLSINQTGDNYARLGAPAGASIAADIAEVEGETDAIIATLGTPAGASVSADLAEIEGETDTIIANLATAQTAITDIQTDVDEVQVTLGAPAGASISADIAEVEGETDAIIATLAGGGGGASVNVTSINGSTSAAAKLALSAVSIISGAAAAGTLTTTQLTTNLAETNVDQYVGRAIVFTSGVLLGQAATITAYLPTGGKLTVTELTDAPSNADTFVIL